MYGYVWYRLHNWQYILKKNKSITYDTTVLLVLLKKALLKNRKPMVYKYLFREAVIFGTFLTVVDRRELVFISILLFQVVFRLVSSKTVDCF